VDDAYAFGAIAATNAFSDVYAMGAEPLLALNLVAWPRDPAMLELLGDTIRGGADIAREAGAPILGGHSIDDAEPKFGMVVVGEAHPDHILTNAGARPGDRLVLTKPIGNGIFATALKRDLVSEAGMAEAIRAMTTLNAGAARAARALGSAVHAATDVTGFGLLGHLRNILAASGCGARLWADRIPRFTGVTELVERGAVSGGTTRNLAAAAAFTRWAPEITSVTKTLLADAQTSGGLLLAVDPRRVDDLVGALRGFGAPAQAVIGELVPSTAAMVEVMASHA